MTKTKRIFPSLLSADFLRLGKEIEMVEKAGADGIHCDIMDGRFVPNITFGPLVVKKVREATKLPIDVHLMINNPENYIVEFIKSGADLVSVHFENNIHLNRTINLIKENGAQAGVAINPSTPVFLLENILEYVDFVLIMSVNPGFGGQKFIGNCYNKIRQLADLRNKNNHSFEVEIDGGINSENIKAVMEEGVDFAVAGASVFGAENPSEMLKKMKEIVTNL